LMGSLRTDEVEVRIIFDIGLGWRSLARCERARMIIEYVRTRLPNLSPWRPVPGSTTRFI